MNHVNHRTSGSRDGMNRPALDQFGVALRSLDRGLGPPELDRNLPLGQTLEPLVLDHLGPVRTYRLDRPVRTTLRRSIMWSRTRHLGPAQGLWTTGSGPSFAWRSIRRRRIAGPCIFRSGFWTGSLVAISGMARPQDCPKRDARHGGRKQFKGQHECDFVILVHIVILHIREAELSEHTNEPRAVVCREEDRNAVEPEDRWLVDLGIGRFLEAHRGLARDC